MAQYDPSIIQQFADALYSQANSIIVSSTFIAAVVGAGAGYFVAQQAQLPVPAVAGGAALVVGLVGLAIGRARAFKLKLLAQTAMCLITIEANTRETAS